jgi:ABC-2 type transport system permease protein
MNWRTVATYDLKRSVNQRGIWALLGGFLLGFGGLAALILYLGDPNFQGYVELVKAGAGLLIPLAGIVLGYEAIIGERESGTAILSLSLPQSRADLVVGKLLSRTVLLSGAIVVSALLTAVLMVPTYPEFDAVQYVGLVVGVAGYGVVFLWLSTALSMTLSTSRRVIAAAFGLYIALTLFWSVLIDLLVMILFRFQTPQEPELWATFSSFVGPTSAYNYLLADLADIGSPPPVTLTSSAEFITPAVAVLGLAGWAVLPIVVGYISFRRADLP